eukprot:gene5551-5967_t
MLIIRILILSCLLSSTIFIKAEDRQCVDKVPIKDWTFSLQNWCKRDEVQIHGLWPNPDCKECYKNPFSVDQLEPDTLKSMGKYWNACGDQTNEDLWEHEWGKHGCGSGLTMSDYFRTTMNIYNHYKSSCDFKGKKDCKIVLSNEEVQSFVSVEEESNDWFSIREKIGWLIVKFIALVLFISLVGSTSRRASRTTNEGLELPLIEKDQRDLESQESKATEET